MQDLSELESDDKTGQIDDKKSKKINSKHGHENFVRLDMRRGKHWKIEGCRAFRDAKEADEEEHNTVENEFDNSDNHDDADDVDNDDSGDDGRSSLASPGIAPGVRRKPVKGRPRGAWRQAARSCPQSLCSAARHTHEPISTRCCFLLSLSCHVLHSFVSLVPHLN